MIYWVTTNLWTVGQGIVTRRLYPAALLELPEEVEPDCGQAAHRPATATAKPKPARAVAPEADDRRRQRTAPAQPRPVRRRKKKGPRTRR